jgi:hypothetical protein
MTKAAIPPPAHRFPGGSIGLSALALALAACSSAGTHPAAAGTSAPTGLIKGATYTGTVYIGTQISFQPTSWHLSKTFATRVPTSRNCAATAKTGTGSGVFQVPSPQPPLPQFSVLVAGFHGPGTYTPTMMKKDKADTILVSGRSGKSGIQRYIITSTAPGITSGKEVLFVNKNGSGELVYSGAHLDGKKTGPAVRGLITWTCKS